MLGRLMVSFPHVFQCEMSSLQAMGEVRKKAISGLDWPLWYNL